MTDPMEACGDPPGIDQARQYWLPRLFNWLAVLVLLSLGVLN
jgi:hypothetical protein